MRSFRFGYGIVAVSARLRGSRIRIRHVRIRNL